MTCIKCQHNTAKKFGFFGKRHIQRYRCNSCRSTFADPQAVNPLGVMRLPMDSALRVLHCLVEGCSIRSTERLTGVNRNTILSLLEFAGRKCATLMNESMRFLPCKRIQCDEIWTYVGKKQRRIRKGAPEEIGDQWIFVAMDADTKLIPSYAIGKRSRWVTKDFIKDLHARLLNPNIQLTTDGFVFYRDAVDEHFGMDVQFAQLVKLFGDYGQHGNEKYSPGAITEVISRVRQGNPDPKHISTSFVERQNMTLRMQCRRLTRLTNAFSRKLDNLRAAAALHFAYYNFCRVHQTLRVSPCMEAGLTDHVWSIAELLAAA